MLGTRKLLMLGFVVALTGCGASSMTSTGGNHQVSVEDNFYSPKTVTLSVGDTVTWTWMGANQHTVTFDDGPGSATQSTGGFQRVFDAAGTYPYHCLVHGLAMSGTVTVQ